MAGSSLWLLPPPGSPIHDILKTLISTALPSQFPAESTSATLGPGFFAPHLTLTSEIKPEIYGSDPKAWLDSISWPLVDEVRVRFEKILSQDVFFRRCYIKVAMGGVKPIVALARARAVCGEEAPGERTNEWLKWWEEAFGPHVSLMYGSVEMDNAKLAAVTKAAEDAGITFSAGDTEGEGSGWDGGLIWLVPTDSSIPEWRPIAARQL